MLHGLLRLIAYLPLGLLHRVGAALGWLVYQLSPTYAARMRENLRASGIAGANTLLPQARAEAGKSVAEIPKIWFGVSAQVTHLVQCNDWAVVESALARRKGIIFLTPHLGCFEIAAQYGAQRFPITVLYRPPKLRWLEPLMIAGRARAQAKLAPANFKGVRLLYKALQRGEAVGLLPDQAPGVGEGAWAEFFGRPAYTMTLVRRLQQATNASIIMAFAERLADARGYRLHLAEVPAEGFDEAALNRAVEAMIRKCPAQYLWGYNRYKVPAGAALPPS
jgi:KDO2-lipid IV(A) lauroyltransferase